VHRPRTAWLLGLAGILVTGVLVVVVEHLSRCELPGLAGPAPAFGLTVPGLPGDTGQLDAATAAIGSAPQIVMWYSAWQEGADFPAAAARRTAAQGAVPQVTWEPWDPAAGPQQTSFPLPSIATGAFDTYVSRWAAAAAAYGSTVMIRFAHEMNADTYPWSETGGRNPAGSYVAAWRHVHDLFADAGALNVQWVWSPNVPFDGTTALDDLYPGDAYVDAVALDGYNWSSVQPDTSWRSFEEVFGDGLAQLADLTDKPVLIGETASTEQDGDKAAWVTDMFETLEDHPEICGFTWFDFVKETDWRIASSPGSMAAFRAGLAARRD
jgi:hypothetical protein